MSGIRIKNSIQICKPGVKIIVAVAIVSLGSAQLLADSKVQVPLLDDGVLIRVPVIVFGRKHYFVVDTGFSISVLDKKFKPQLGERLSTVQAIDPLNQAELLPMYHGLDISLGGRSQHLDRIGCLDLKMANLISGQPCDGILGMDFFSNRVVTLDFDQATLSLARLVPDPAMIKSSLVVPLKPFYANFTVAVTINRGTVCDLLIDTSDTSSLSLNAEAWRQIFPNRNENMADVTLAGTGNTVGRSKIGVVDRLELASYSYTNLHATLIQNSKGPSHMGLAFFRRHLVTFDFARQTMFLRPGRNIFERDQEDKSGLHLLREDQCTFVYSVDENSPAFAAGIRPQDVMVNINGQDVASSSLRVIRNLLQNSLCGNVRLRLQRGNELFEVQF